MFLQFNHLHWHQAFWTVFLLSHRLSACSGTSHKLVPPAWPWTLSEVPKSWTLQPCTPLWTGLAWDISSCHGMQSWFQQWQLKKAPLGKHQKLRIATMDLNLEPWVHKHFKPALQSYSFPALWHSLVALACTSRPAVACWIGLVGRCGLKLQKNIPVSPDPLPILAPAWVHISVTI